MNNPVLNLDAFRLKIHELLDSGTLHGSLADYVALPVRELAHRAEAFFSWQQARRERGLWSYSNAIRTAPRSGDCCDDG